MSTITHFIAWHLTFGWTPVYLPRAARTSPKGMIDFLETNIQKVKITPLKEYWYCYPEVQMRVLGAKMLLKQYRKLGTTN